MEDLIVCSRCLKHNALWDARVIRMCYDKMMNKTNTL